MNRQEIEMKVLSVITTLLKCGVTLDSSRDNLPQWDSLKHIEIIFAVEDELGIQFTEAELSALNSARRIVDAALIRYAP